MNAWMRQVIRPWMLVLTEPANHKRQPLYYFAKGMGVIYAIAFLSLMVQWNGLYGPDGIFPLETTLSALNSYSFFTVPHLFFSSHPVFVWSLLGMGLVASLCLILGYLPLISAITTWSIYLSCISLGRDFMSFQWDILLVEMGFLLLFSVPMTVKWTRADSFTVPRILIWAYYACCIRLLFMSAAVKLLSHDPSWSELSALFVHYYTQPLPHMGGWLAHQLPQWAHRFSVIVMFVIEFGAPVLIVINQRTRRVACYSIWVLMAVISLTGNYGFFNLLTALLAYLLLDDSSATLKQVNESKHGEWVTQVKTGVAITVIMLGLCTEGSRLFTGPLQKFCASIKAPFNAFHISNGYGLFAVMTQSRQELEIWGSLNGSDWKPYLFKVKPNTKRDQPKWVWPHQPRFDWQCWFVPLRPYSQYSWINACILSLFEQRKSVEALFKAVPFEQAPQQLVLVTRDYRFTSIKEKRDGDKWWVTGNPVQFSPIFKNPAQ